MASSSVPLSLLAKGIGQLSKNGHERLDVYLEPEDYYNLESKYKQYQLQALRREAARTNTNEVATNIPLHKTFLTRKGALLLFSEELAKKALEEERSRHEAKIQKELDFKSPRDAVITLDKTEADPIRTCNDLSWAILSYGNKPDYRKKGSELYLRFIHEPKGSVPERRIRPGFSPKRYISTWSRYWDEGMLQKLRSGGMISDKTLYRQNPLLPHLYKYATYNLSAIPPPYRVTKNMLLAPGNVPSYEFYRVKGHPESVTSHGSASRAPPPSQLEPAPSDVAPLGAIQAVKYHDSGEIQEVTYSELKPQEKQDILAELLIAAHEHQQHIRDTLELVLSSKRVREGSDREGSSSAASELMADMQRAILSLVESPVRQQMKERQRLVQEQEEKMQERKRQQELKEERRQKRRQERKAQKAAEQALKKKEAEEAQARKAAEKAVKRKEQSPPILKKKEETPPEPEKIPVDSKEEEERQIKEERRRKRKEERENRRKMREKKNLEKEATMKQEQETERLASKLEEAQRPPSRDEQRHDEERQHRSHRRHKHLPDEPPPVQEERNHRSDRKHRRASDKDARRSQHDDEVPPGIAQGAYQADGYHGNDIYAILPQDGFTEIKHVKGKTSKHHRQHAGMGPGVPTQVPTNTPAVDMRVLARPQLKEEVEYDEVILLEPPNGRRRRSHASSIDESRGIISSEKREVLKEGLNFSPHAPRSAASSHSSAAKQVVFAPELPNDDTASVKQGGSFYGGRMPITSNLVKHTLSDKVSILSGGHDSKSLKEVRSHASPKSQADHPSVTRKSYKSSEEQVSEKALSLVHSSIVPSIGIEPATPLAPIQKSVSPFQKSVLSTHSTVPGTHYLSPSASMPGSHKSFEGRSQRSDQASGKDESIRGSDGGRSSKKLPSRNSDSDKEDSDNNDDDTSQSSQASEQKSLKRSVASKSSQTTSRKSKKSKHASLVSDDTFSTSGKSWMNKESVGEPTYSGMKGFKGPGSQSSSSNLKSTSTKKSRSSRGNIPSAMKRGHRGEAASLTLPDGEVVSVGGSLVRSSGETIIESETEKSEAITDTISKATLEEHESEDVSLPKPALKSAADSSNGDRPSSVKPDRRVSFQEVASASEDDEDQDKMSSDIEPTDYDVTDEEVESENEESDWPAVKEEIASQGEASSDSRSISSRSEKLTAHAQKIAAIVVKKQRPGSGLDEDAKQAAELWNKTLDAENEESEVTSEEEEEEWQGAKKVPSSTSESSKSQISENTKESVEDQRRKDRLKKILADKKKEKELRPSISSTPKLAPIAKEPSVPDTISSIASTVSSVQEAFVNEIQRKASDLGIEPSDLEFQADVVSKLEKSSIGPDDVEVVHDKEAGRHVVRSRRSSITVSSVLTPSSEELNKSTPRDVMKQSEPPKQKLVVDLNLDKQSASMSRRSSVTSSMSSTSYASPLHSARSSATQRRSSIPVDKGEVKLDYDVTTYEGKLGEPKSEDPTIQPGRPHVEPEKIKNVEPMAKPGTEIKQKLGSKISGPGSVSSSQVSKNKSTSKQPAAKTKVPNAPTKGPLRKGQVANLKAEDTKSDAASVAEPEALTEDEKLQRDLAKITEAQKSVTKKDSKKKKPSKGKPKAAESVISEKDTRKPTPEKPATKTPETPFRTGQPKEQKPTTEDFGDSPDETAKQESIASISKSRKSDKTAKKPKKKEAVITQVEVDTPKVETQTKKLPVSARPTPSPAKKSDIGDDESDLEEYVPAESPDDEYEFVRKEDTPEPTPEPEPEVIQSPPKSSPKPEDTKSQTSEVTEMTETTERSSQLAAQAAEDEAEREAKLAAKQEREQKRAAAAERRRQEVERKRKEKEEQLKREKEELERQEQMREELDAERRKREEAVRLKKQEAEQQKQREKEEEELRQKRLLLEQERDRKQKEEYRRKMEEVQRKKREEEEKKLELAKIAAAEEAERKRQEEELMAQMEESERLAYAEQKRKEEEERKRKEEEKRKREEEEAKIAMEQARIEAIIRAKQAAALEEKLRFVREFFTEANGLDQTQNVHRSFTFSYFELMRMLGLDVPID